MKAAVKKGIFSFSVFVVIAVAYIFIFPGVVDAYIRVGLKWGLILGSPLLVFSLGISLLLAKVEYDEQRFMEKSRIQRQNFDEWFDKWIVRRGK